MYALFHPDQWRYERKFFISGLSKHEVESIVKLHPAMFSEIYYERTVNNIYLDSIDRGNYLDNVVGNSQRLKVRIRWYGDLFGSVEKPFLEIKTKSGYLSSKIAYELDPITIDRTVSLYTIRRILKNSSSIPDIIKPDLMSLGFSLLNNYRRKYFQSDDKKFRITIDSNMQFFEISPMDNSFLHKSVDYTSTILELKYDRDEDDHAENITKQFPFRITKSSKYVAGIDRVHV